MQKHIGIFDSGVGGLSVWQQIRKQFDPTQVALTYVADQAFCPYGQKPQTLIRERSLKVAEFLLRQGAQMLVVACNTATAAAIDTLREYFQVPIVGMEPAIKPAALHTKTGHIGLLATEGTLQGRLFKETRARFVQPELVLHTQVGYGLVELVETGKANSPESLQLLQQYLTPMLEANIDYLVLGCTHYPFLRAALTQVIGNSVTILEPAEAVATQVQRRFKETKKGVKLPSQDQFFTTSPDLCSLLDFVQYTNAVKTETAAFKKVNIH